MRDYQPIVARTRTVHRPVGPLAYDVMPDDTVDGQPGEPFNILFNPDVQRAALARQQGAAESGPQTGNVVGLNNDDLVGPAGIEPTTSTV